MIWLSSWLWQKKNDIKLYLHTSKQLLLLLLFFTKIQITPHKFNRYHFSSLNLISTLCTSSMTHPVMFFFINKHIMIDLGTGNNKKINWSSFQGQARVHWHSRDSLAWGKEGSWSRHCSKRLPPSTATKSMCYF